jgi:hypothetical protein
MVLSCSHGAPLLTWCKNYYYLIAEFYLVDRGLRHRLPGFSSLNRLSSLRRVSAGLIAEFYLVDRGLRHRLPPGFSSMGRLVILP